MDKNYSYTKAQDDNTEELTLTVVVNADFFTQRKEQVYKKLASNIEIKGFRPGKAPKAMIEARLGPDLYEKTLNELLPEVTAEILEEIEEEPLSQVKYEVTKVAEGEGVTYKASFVKYPEVKLGNWKKIKPPQIDVEVSDREVESEMNRITEMYFKEIDKQKVDPEIGKEGDTAEREKSGEKAEKDEQADDETEEKLTKESKTEKKVENKDSSLPESEEKKLTDEIVASLGMGFKTVADLKKYIREQLEHQKLHQQEDKQVAEVLAQAAKEFKIPAPKQMVDNQVERRKGDYVGRIEQLGIKLDDFLKTQNTDMDKLEQSWREEAKQQVQNELLLFEIVKLENLKVTKEEIEAQINSLQDESLRKEYDSYQGRLYIGNVILQQKALEWIKRELGIVSVHSHDHDQSDDTENENEKAD